MSKFASSIPVQTSITESNALTIPWRKWFKDIGDDWISANNCIIAKSTDPIKGFNYLVNNGITFFTFSGIVLNAFEIPLPFTVLADSAYQQNIVGAEVPLTLCKLSSGATTLAVPVGEVLISGWYFNKLSGK